MEKKTSNMLIRDIPIDIWERIDKLCRRKNLKRRDFVEQALRFFEGDDAEYERKESESGQLTDIKGLTGDIEYLQLDAEQDDDKQEVEFEVEPSKHRKRVGIEQIKPERVGSVTMKLPNSGIGASPSEEGQKGVMTTVFCWGLDRLDN